MDGVIDVRSLTRGPEDLEDIGESPFWSRLLLAPDRSASFVVLRIGNDDHAETVSAIDQILERHSADGFVLGASGVPYVAEHIRRQLTEELQRLSIAAFAAFAALIAVLFRSPAIVVGSMVTALTASFGTFLVRALAGMRTDILAPNLWTIAFVLTISHIVYLTAQWRRQAREANDGDAVSGAIRLVGPVSAWSLVANLLGFASLLFVSAKAAAAVRIVGHDRGSPGDRLRVWTVSGVPSRRRPSQATSRATHIPPRRLLHNAASAHRVGGAGHGNRLDAVRSTR